MYVEVVIETEGVEHTVSGFVDIVGPCEEVEVSQLRVVTGAWEVDVYPDSFVDELIERARELKELQRENAEAADYWDEYDRGDDDFADPGGRSALRAASPSNPRNLPCPTCEAPNRLTPADARRGYQCDRCADLDERGGY